MKTIKKLKGLLKAVVFAMVMVFVLQGCDDEQPIEKETQKAYKPYKTSFLSKENFKDQPVLDKIIFFNKQIAEKKQEKSVHSELYNFTILTEVAFYVEYEDGTSSYTFPIIRAVDNGAQETFVLTTDLDGNYRAQYFSYNFTEEDLTYNGSEDLRDISDKVTIINIEDDDLILEVVQTKCNDCGVGEPGSAYGHWETVWNPDWRTYMSTYVIDGYFPTADLDVCIWCGVCPTCDGAGGAGAGGAIPGIDSSDNTNYVGAGTSTIHTITTGRTGFGNILLYSGLMNHGISINISWIRQSQNNATQAQNVLDFLNEDGNDTPEAQDFAQEAMDAMEVYSLSQEIYSISNYPGKNLNYPFEWWKNNNFIINSGNFDLPSDNLNMPNEQPNAAEVILFGMFPIFAMQHIENSYDALQRAGELASSFSDGTSGLHNGKADAFRHAYWNALGTVDFGSTIMKLFADAHEFNSESQIETNMDLFNNNVGRVLANQNNFTVSTLDILISDTIEQAVFSGDMKYINNNNLVFTNE